MIRTRVSAVHRLRRVVTHARSSGTQVHFDVDSASQFTSKLGLQASVQWQGPT